MASHGKEIGRQQHVCVRELQQRIYNNANWKSGGNAQANIFLYSITGPVFEVSSETRKESGLRLTRPEDASRPSDGAYNDAWRKADKERERYVHILFWSSTVSSDHENFPFTGMTRERTYPHHSIDSIKPRIGRRMTWNTLNTLFATGGVSLRRNVGSSHLFDINI